MSLHLVSSLLLLSVLSAVDLSSHRVSRDRRSAVPVRFEAYWETLQHGYNCSVPGSADQVPASPVAVSTTSGGTVHSAAVKGQAAADSSQRTRCSGAEHVDLKDEYSIDFDRFTNEFYEYEQGVSTY